ncbi:MAG: sigma-70 family RNA polymerase sigma factor [Armatimonadota bacterium]|nr:MAG: sigma-70 family RNA polymerase sigma factor [Armatimonadota bacterium]
MSEDRDEVRELAARARAGEVGAFEALYQMHQAGIYTFIRSQVREAELAADLTQDTFVRAWESLPRLRKVGAFRGWLYQIARNLVRDEVKSGRARLEMLASAVVSEQGAELPEPAAEGERPEDLVVSEEVKGEIWRALESLPAEQREAVVMHHMEGMGMKEIAEVMRVRPGTVMSRLARAREALRKRLSEYVEGSDEGM